MPDAQPDKKTDVIDLEKLVERGLEKDTIDLIITKVAPEDLIRALTQAASWIYGRTVIIEQGQLASRQKVDHQNSLLVANQTLRNQIDVTLDFLFKIKILQTEA